MIIQLRSIPPDPSISDFVQSFWSLENPSDQPVDATVLPDGIVDLFLFHPLHTSDIRLELKGLETEPSEVVIEPKRRMLAIGFKLPAVEYLFNGSIASSLNRAQNTGNGFWQFDDTDFGDFERFCNKATIKIRSIISSAVIDPRKQALFHLLYTHNGSLTVQQLAQNTYWPARQINRYFNQQFGLSLKAYSNILRFRASFDQLKQGKLFPEQNFFDQAHFIKAVKKLSGVVPKQLKENKNDRFL